MEDLVIIIWARFRTLNAALKGAVPEAVAN